MRLLVLTIPIALLVNVIRITVTGVLHQTVGHRVANVVFHDLAGWLMMPLALGLLGIESALLPHLLIPVPLPAPTHSACHRAVMKVRNRPRT